MRSSSRRYNPQKYAPKPEQVELYMSCKGLRNMDVLSKSDPQIRLYTKDNGKWRLYGNTETRKNNLNPIFRVTFTFEFVFEVPQHLRFEVVDVDGPDASEIIGGAETTLSAIMGARNQSLTLDLTHRAAKNCGKLTIKGEQYVETRNIVIMQWAGVRLMNTDGLREKSDPSLRFFKKRAAGGDWLQVHQTEVIMNELNPVWKPIELGDSKLCLNHNEKIRIECWDYEKSGDYQYIGDCEITLNMLKAGEDLFDLQNYKVRGKPGTLRLVDFTLAEPAPKYLSESNIDAGGPQKPSQNQNQYQDPYYPDKYQDQLQDPYQSGGQGQPKPQPQNQYQNKYGLENIDMAESQYISQPKPKPPTTPSNNTNTHGSILSRNKPTPQQNPYPQQQQQVPKPAFMDYLRSGTTLNTVVAIDFSSSNGALTSPNSLHAIHQDGAMNEYQKAIYCVCQILLNYDYDNQVAMFGFGAIPNYPALKSKTVSDCFPLTGSFENQQAQGLQGVMDVYNYALQNVELAGPTNFAPILRESCNVAEANKKANNDVYTILLIVTSGKCSDMEETKDLIVRAAALPLSVIIVGVGNGDFTNMEILDGDYGLVNSKGEKAKRDLVQFVPFKEFNDMNSLAQEVLREVPDQLVEYNALIGKMPRGWMGNMM